MYVLQFGTKILECSLSLPSKSNSSHGYCGFVFRSMLHLVIVFIFSLDQISCLPPVVRVGGLFTDAVYKDVENAFKFAVQRINKDSSLLKNTRLEYIVEHVPAEDTHLAAEAACKQLTMGMMALFGPQENRIAAHINSLCNSVDIPHIEARPELEIDSSLLSSLNLYPDIATLNRAYMDCIRYFGWRKILVLYTDYDALLKLSPLLQAPIANDMDMIIRQVDQENLHSILRDADKFEYNHILAEMSVDDTRALLKAALQEGMIDTKHHYILTNPDAEFIDMEDFRYNSVNLTTFRLVPRDSAYTMKIVDEMRHFQRRTGKMILQRNEFISTEAALMYDAVYTLAYGLVGVDNYQSIASANLSCLDERQWAQGSTLYNALNNVNIEGLTGKIHRFQDGRRRDVKLDVLFMSAEGLRKVGHWSHGEGMNLTENYEAARKGVKYGFNATLNVTSIIDAPFVMLQDGKENEDGNGRYMGFCIELLEEIARNVGFNYRINLVPDGKYGAKNEKGEWNGMVKELIEGRADLAVASLTISYTREQAIDFTKPFMNLGISILFKVPESQTPGLFSFLNPLALEIWLYVMVAYFVVSFLMFIMARFSPYEWTNPHPCNDDTEIVYNEFNLSNSFWFTVGTLMQQGSDINPRALSTRIIGGVWWFFTLIIISSYTANLAAFLTVERKESPIDDAGDLAAQTDISYGTIQGGSTMTFFRESNIKTYETMWKFMKQEKPSVFVKDSVEGIERVKLGNYAFLMESVMIDYNVQRNCTLMQVGGLLDSKGYGIGTPIGSRYTDQISLAILELQENGKIQMMYDKWWKHAGTCNRDDSKESKANALGVANVGGIFVVLLVGLSLAVIVAIIEFIVSPTKFARIGDNHVKRSLCGEMLYEFQFALRCRRRRRAVPKNARAEDAPGEAPNGIIQLRELRGSPMPGFREYRYPSPLPDLYSRPGDSMMRPPNSPTFFSMSKSNHELYH